MYGSTNWAMRVKYIDPSHFCESATRLKSSPMEDVRDTFAGLQNVGGGTNSRSNRQESQVSEIEECWTEHALKLGTIKSGSRGCVPKLDERSFQIVVKTRSGRIRFEGNIAEFGKWIA